MTATLLDGKQLAETMEAEIAAGVADFVKERGHPPGLATVLVGTNDASQRYVRGKHKACQRVGITSFQHELSATTTEAELLDLVARLNADASGHGVLVQLPLPPHIPAVAIVDAVPPPKHSHVL